MIRNLYVRSLKFKCHVPPEHVTSHTPLYRYLENSLCRDILVVADHSQQTRIPPIPSDKSTPSNVRELQGYFAAESRCDASECSYNLHASGARTARTDIDSLSARIPLFSTSDMVATDSGWVVANNQRSADTFMETNLEGSAKPIPLEPDTTTRTVITRKGSYPSMESYAAFVYVELKTGSIFGCGRGLDKLHVLIFSQKEGSN